MLKYLKHLLPNLVWLAAIVGLAIGLILTLRNTQAIQTGQISATTPTLIPDNAPTVTVLSSIFLSPPPGAVTTPIASPSPSWNWQPTATALAQVIPSPTPIPTATPFGGLTTPTPAVASPPPTMMPPKVFRAEKLEVADVRFVDFDARFEFVDWSPDGTYILVKFRDPEHSKQHRRVPGKHTRLLSLWLMKPDGTDRRQVAEWAASSAAWSPDGKYIAYSTPAKDEGTEGVVYVVDVESLKSWKVAENDFIGWQDIYWLSNNELTFVKDGYIFAARADGSGTRQLNDIYIRPESAENLVPGHYRVSPDGQKVAWIPGENVKRLWIANLDGSDKVLVSDKVSRRGAARATAWSPDSQYLAFTVFNGLGPEGGDLWIANADGSNPHPIATTKREWESLVQPIWSPDSQVIAFIKGTNQMDSTLWIVNRDGTGLKPLGGNRAGLVNFPFWSPTGTQIAYNRQLWEPSGQPNVAIITLKQQP